MEYGVRVRGMGGDGGWGVSAKERQMPKLAVGGLGAGCGRVSWSCQVWSLIWIVG
jgi:hypothetical protein